MTTESSDQNGDVEDGTENSMENGMENGMENKADETLETTEGESGNASSELSQEGLQAALDEARDQALRTQAEMQNLRRRAERDVENAHKYALEKFVNELLPVVDNLERAITSIDHDNEVFEAVGEGVELTLKTLIDTLTRNKVEQVNPVEQVFDPELHQAVTMAPHPELPANTVIEVFQKGYSLNGRLVRPAMVVVSQGSGDGESKA